jgi:hypothetical protein
MKKEIIFEASRLKKLAGIKEQKNNISYTGLVLTSSGHEELTDRLKDKFPGKWEKVAHHVTVNMGSFKGDRELLNRKFPVEIISFLSDDKVCAVGVRISDITTKENPHITMAVDRENGGKPAMSNKLSWSEAEPITPFVLEGTLLEVQQGDNRFSDQYTEEENNE